MCIISNPSNGTPAYLVTADPTGPLVETLRAAVRRRRVAEANYGRALVSVNYELTSEQRDALYEKHRIAIGEAESAVAAATAALVASLEGAL